MDYAKHYNLLMARSPKAKVKREYRERHRIQLGCMGGKYVVGNIAYLTPEEHFVAHQLLVKMYPKHRGLIHAANMMGNRTNKHYGWIKRQHAREMSRSRIESGIASGERNVSKRLDVKEKQRLVWTPERRAQKSREMSFWYTLERKAKHVRCGTQNPNYGKKWTQEMKDIMSQKKKGIVTISMKKPKSPEHRKNLSLALKAYHDTSRNRHENR